MCIVNSNRNIAELPEFSLRQTAVGTSSDVEEIGIWIINGDIGSPVAVVIVLDR